MSDPAPPTDDERLQICRRILLSSPPGQFDLILADLRVIQKAADKGGASLLSEKFVESVRDEHENRTGRRLLRGDHNDDDDGTDGSDGADQLAAKIRCVLKERVAGYVSMTYPLRDSAAFRVLRSGPDEISVATYAERVDLRNYHAGSWSASYTVNVSASGEAMVTGKVDLHAHAFENGNVQLRSQIDALGPASVRGAEGGPASLADAIVTQIAQWESEDVQGRLGSMYDEMGDMMLKSLRRIMPVTRTRMDWNVRAHRVAKTFASAGKSSEAVGQQG